MYRHLLLLFVCVLTYSAHSQNPVNTTKGATYSKIRVNSHETNKDLMAELEGTFEVRVSNNKKVLFSEDLLRKIKESRQITQDVYLEVEEGIIVYIPSKFAINSPEFKKLPKVTYLSNTTNHETK